MFFEVRPLIGDVSSQEFLRVVWGLFPVLLVVVLPIVAVSSGAIIGLTKLVLTHSRAKLFAEMEATLKMEMITRGMSAADIQQVLDARISATSFEKDGDSSDSTSFCGGWSRPAARSNRVKA